jgi:putative oxidoreductase
MPGAAARGCAHALSATRRGAAGWLREGGAEASNEPPASAAVSTVRVGAIATQGKIRMRIRSDVFQQHPGVLLLRFTVAGLMLFHGVAKLRNGVEEIGSLLQAHGMPTWLAYAAFIGEIVAPLFVIGGVWVRAAALVIAINMIIAVALAHSAQLLSVGNSGGYALELQALYLLGALAIAWLADGGRKR